VVEDHRTLNALIAAGLRREALAVDAVLDGRAALEQLAATRYDVVVLDRDLPGVHGDEVCRRIVAAGADTRVLMLTAAGTVRDRVEGLGLGADDYLPKPFDLSELEARLRALHRRNLGAVHSVLRVGSLEYDTVSRRFTIDARHLELPPREHDLLEALISRLSRPVSKNLLADGLRSSDSVLSHDALEVYVHRLRRRLQGSGAAIHTVRGLGYVLEPSDEAPE